MKTPKAPMLRHHLGIAWPGNDDPDQAMLEVYENAGLTEGADFTIHPTFGALLTEAGKVRFHERFPWLNQKAPSIAELRETEEGRMLLLQAGIHEERDYSKRKRTPRKPKP
ncbi:hypothetical protein M0638_07690 [Roseomonas sp. NAR14]|uniref:Uncharacterized protein n=1 Tax=Roseomonas acroporae TaxID=2937791 RepID=A0A9X2BT55_9PROT|nr:hypothetical protein [Roseomonas acroporae]MCK8784258.1 hypothetical protein [Roseomonas acroporae]